MFYIGRRAAYPTDSFCEWLLNRVSLEPEQRGGRRVVGVLADVAELADVEGLDPHIKNDLCRHGAQALAFTIKALGLTIAEKREYIDDVLSGIVAAEMHARRQAVDLICPSVPVSP